MTDKFKGRLPQTREDAISHIDKVAKHFDINLEEDFLLQAFSEMQATSNERNDALLHQITGCIMDSAKLTNISINHIDLLDREPYVVNAEIDGDLTHFELVAVMATDDAGSDA